MHDLSSRNRPAVCELGATTLSFTGATAVFGTPVDITLSELAIASRAHDVILDMRSLCLSFAGALTPAVEVRRWRSEAHPETGTVPIARSELRYAGKSDNVSRSLTGARRRGQGIASAW